MNNQLADANVGNLNFKPMPKRFMVWDKVGKRFLGRRLPDGVDTVFSIFELPLEIDCLDEEEKEQFTICQSTNLFGKDGKEIFEGSIVEAFTNINKISDPKLSDNEPRYGLKIVELYDGAFRLSSKKFPHGCGILNNYVGAMAKDLKVVGHILSNPELLEEKDV